MNKTESMKTREDEDGRDEEKRERERRGRGRGVATKPKRRRSFAARVTGTYLGNVHFTEEIFLGSVTDRG